MSKRVLSTLRPVWATEAETKRVITVEKNGLLRNWLSNNGGQLVVGIASVQALCITKIEWSRQGYNIVSINNLEKKETYDVDKVFALVGNNREDTECWVLGSEEDYRAIYHDYLTQFYNFEPNTRISSIYHIDHVLARTRADKMFSDDTRSYYLRVTIAAGDANVDAGRIYERFASDRDLRTTPLGQAIFNFPLAMKAFALQSPKSRDYSDDYVVGVCREMFHQFLLPESELDAPYVLIRNIIMQSSNHAPVDNSICIVRGNYHLEMVSSLRDWIKYY